MRGKSLQEVKSFSIDCAKVYFEQKTFAPPNFERGYKYFSDGYVADIWTEVMDKAGKTSVIASCYRSMKKTAKPHTLSMVICGDKIEETHCSCVIGLSQNCGHLIGLAYTLQHLLMKGYDTIPDEKSRTDLPQKWGKPSRSSKIEPECVLNTSLSAPQEKQNVRPPLTCSIRRNPTTLTNNIITKPTIEQAREAIAQFDCQVPFGYLLTSSAEASEGTVETVQLPFDLLTERDAILDYQWNGCNFGELLHSNAANETDVELYKRFPLDCCTRKAIPLLSKGGEIVGFPEHRLTFDGAMKLEEETRQQTKSVQWFREREKRLTASNFGKILNRQRAVTDAMLRNVFCNKDLNHVRSIRHGRKNESVARMLYLQKYKHISHFDVGLVVNPYMSFLGGSPDGHIIDNSEIDQENGVLEIKCPLWTTLHEGLEKDRPCIILDERTGNISLAATSDYYAQVQGQLLVTGAQWCDFVIFVAASNELHVERICFNIDYCITLYQTLADFYTTHAIPYLQVLYKEN